MDVKPTTLTRIREHVLRHTARPGRTLSALPELYYFRADRPVGPKPVGTPGVLVAVIADRAKTVLLADGRSVRYEAGSYLFVTREARYSSCIHEATPERPYLSFAMHLDSDVVARTLLAIDDALDAGDAEGGEDVDAWVGEIDDALGDGFLRLLDAIDDPLERRVVAPLVVQELVFRLLRSDYAAPLRRAVRDDDERIREAMRFVREHPSARLNVEQLARRVAMSPSHFAHRFRDVARVSPMRFVKTVRLGRARLLMLRDGLRASEAAAEVGYASPSHFSRDFKAQYGAAPAAYARELRDRHQG